MKRVVLIALIMGMASVWGAQNIAIVKNVAGSVVVKQGTEYKKLRQGNFLQEGDILQTSDESSVGLAFNDGTLVSLGPKSIFRVTRYRFKPSSNDYAFDMTLTKGSAAVETGKIGKLAPENVLFNVPQGYIGIRGTRFVVDVKE